MSGKGRDRNVVCDAMEDCAWCLYGETLMPWRIVHGVLIEKLDCDAVEDCGNFELLWIDEESCTYGGKGYVGL